MQWRYFTKIEVWGNWLVNVIPIAPTYARLTDCANLCAGYRTDCANLCAGYRLRQPLRGLTYRLRQPLRGLTYRLRQPLRGLPIAPTFAPTFARAFLPTAPIFPRATLTTAPTFARATDCANLCTNLCAGYPTDCANFYAGYRLCQPLRGPVACCLWPYDRAFNLPHDCAKNLLTKLDGLNTIPEWPVQGIGQVSPFCSL